MMWNGIHLLISPAASHSGWEDHFQSDQFHYLHHAKFECNYGTSGPPLDKMFGTFREKLGRSLEFNGVADDIREIVTKPNEYLSGSLSLAKAAPTRLDSVVYNSLIYSTFAMFIAKVLGMGFESVDASTAAFLVCYGPVVYGFLVLITFGDNKSFLWPFHKESLFGGLGFHLIVSFLMVVSAPTLVRVSAPSLAPCQHAPAPHPAPRRPFYFYFFIHSSHQRVCTPCCVCWPRSTKVLPVYHFAYSVLAPPGSAPYWQLHQGFDGSPMTGNVTA